MSYPYETLELTGVNGELPDVHSPRYPLVVPLDVELYNLNVNVANYLIRRHEMTDSGFLKELSDDAVYYEPIQGHLRLGDVRDEIRQRWADAGGILSCTDLDPESVDDPKLLDAYKKALIETDEYRALKLAIGQSMAKGMYMSFDLENGFTMPGVDDDEDTLGDTTSEQPLDGGRSSSSGEAQSDSESNGVITLDVEEFIHYMTPTSMIRFLSRRGLTHEQIIELVNEPYSAIPGTIVSAPDNDRGYGVYDSVRRAQQIGVAWAHAHYGHVGQDGSTYLTFDEFINYMLVHQVIPVARSKDFAVTVGLLFAIYQTLAEHRGLEYERSIKKFSRWMNRNYQRLGVSQNDRRMVTSKKSVAALDIPGNILEAVTELALSYKTKTIAFC